MNTAVLVFTAAQVVFVALLIAFLRYGKPPEGGGPKLPERRSSRALPQSRRRRRPRTVRWLVVPK